MMTKIAKFALVTVPPIVAFGFLMGLLSNGGYGNPWFDALAKPAAMPPGWVFGVAWTILYCLLGVALAILLAAPASRTRSAALVLFALQLALNFAWSPLFFRFHLVLAALVTIALILALSIAATALFARIQPAAAWLMAPYLAWLTFATYLNYAILSLNPAA